MPTKVEMVYIAWCPECLVIEALATDKPHVWKDFRKGVSRLIEAGLHVGRVGWVDDGAEIKGRIGACKCGHVSH